MTVSFQFTTQTSRDNSKTKSAANSAAGRGQSYSHHYPALCQYHIHEQFLLPMQQVLGTPTICARSAQTCDLLIDYLIRNVAPHSTEDTTSKNETSDEVDGSATLEQNLQWPLDNDEPALSSTRLDLQAFTAKVRTVADKARSHKIPDRPHPGYATWASAVSWMGKLQGQHAAAETELQPGPLLQGLTMPPEHLVKPIEDISSPIVAFVSYPTKDKTSTMHIDWATVDDMTNMCMYLLDTKLSLHKVLVGPGILHIDIFPRRIDHCQIRCPLGDREWPHSA
ncbi:hypothetical protein HBI81_232850 [Parastagonospora nodorum]|nr:hypothetical protein HBH50_225990 [Parastagonospora nodorum]KAH4528836.1 hypothetical protein HBH85_200710 [Parastagonospora nodorum]KAH4841786.1 hypothetical protein HBH75_222590 [Parastagonospora nodorum]KAH5106578.1 hypothetical protein HBH71_196540 [Parastagonospora nodorum]KAH5178374.1 hypothetical protein HBH76_194790 [Parastagonospora nodorum]